MLGGFVARPHMQGTNRFPYTLQMPHLLESAWEQHQAQHLDMHAGDNVGKSLCSNLI